jgi:hypothetical protein
MLDWLTFSLFAVTLVLTLAVWLLWRGRPRPVPPFQQWRIVLPRDASFSAAQAAAWFTSLAPLLTPQSPSPWVELRSHHRRLGVSIAAPASWEATLRGQLAAWFPHARLEPAELPGETGPLAAVHLTQQRPPIFPIRVAGDDEPDPLLAVLGSLTERDGDCGVRLTWGPAPHDWKRWAPAALAAIRAGQPVPPRGWGLLLLTLYQLVRPSPPGGNPTVFGPSAGELSGAATKAAASVFSVQATVWACDPVREAARQRAQSLAGQLEAAFHNPAGNRLVSSAVRDYETAEALDRRRGPELVLSAEEMGGLFHLPAARHPLVPGPLTRRVPISADHGTSLPSDAAEMTWLGEAFTAETTVPVGLSLPERRQHLYVVGKTGTGKSTLLMTLAQQDLAAGRGVGLIDPHGDLAERILALVPPERHRVVLYFNPADSEFPVGFNLLAAATPAQRPLVASGVIGVFKKLYGESWGPRLEYLFRNAVLALLESPSPSLLLIPKLLTDRHYRRHVLTYVHDPLLRSFFLDEFERYDPRWRMEAISPILNKVGQFLSSPVVRHVVGQSGPGFDLRRLLDEGGIFIANLASGKIGEDNTALLGGLLVTAFQLAAMRRADQPEEQRRDFYLLVDEFQHFANEAFGTILSEARKYRLCLTLSHQYLDQVPPEILDAVLGNAGSVVTFRVGGEDTARLVKELAPSFDGQDLVHLPDYHFSARLVHRGQPLPAFSGRTLLVPVPEEGLDPIIAASRRRLARPVAEVEVEVSDLWEDRAS